MAVLHVVDLWFKFEMKQSAVPLRPWLTRTDARLLTRFLPWVGTNLWKPAWSPHCSDVPSRFRSSIPLLVSWAKPARENIVHRPQQQHLVLMLKPLPSAKQVPPFFKLGNLLFAALSSAVYETCFHRSFILVSNSTGILHQTCGYRCMT